MRNPLNRILQVVLLTFVVTGVAFAAQQTISNAPGQLTKIDQNFTEVYQPVATTANETAAGITIVNQGYEPGDLRRYGLVCLDATADAAGDPDAGVAFATPNTTILNALGAAAWPGPITFKFPSGICRINDAVVLADKDISLWFDNRNELHYYGTADKIAFTLGNSSNSQGSKNAIGGAGIALVNRTTHAWTNDAFVGLQILGTMQNSSATVRNINGFTINWQTRPSTSGIAYNVFYVGVLEGAKYNLDIHSFGANEFVNENLFIGGSWRQTGLAVTNNSYGVRFYSESGGYRGHNRNIFIKPSFELGDAQAGTERIPVLYSNSGVRNEVWYARTETGRGVLVDVVSDAYQVAQNTFNGMVSGGVWDSYIRETAGGLAYNNTTTDIVQGKEYHQPVYESGDLVARAFNTDTAKISVKGTFFQNSGTATEAYTGTAKILRNYISISNSSNAIGVWVDTSYYKSFLIRKDTETGFNGRIAIVAYDSSGNVLDDGDPEHPYINSNGALSGTSGYGFKYASQSDNSGGPIYVSVGPAVAKAKIMFIGGTTALHIRSFSIYGLASNENPKPLRVYTGLAQSNNEWYVSGSPATTLGGGFVARGQLVVNGSAGAGQPDYYVATAEGYNASAWVLSTAYELGSLVNNDTGKIYEQQAAACTSAGSGGPTGTAASGITDNTCSWGYIGTLATWATSSVDQSISPTWTGTHRWSSTEPKLQLYESDAAADEKLWDWDIQAKTLTLRTRTDLDGAGVTLLSFLRGTGTAVSSGQWAQAGAFSFGGPISVGTVSAGIGGVGIYRPGTNQLGFSTASTARGMFDANGAFIYNGAILSAGTKFTASGCSNSTTVGGATAGSFASGTTGACTVTITLPTAPNGWSCAAANLTTPANLIQQSASATTSCTITGTTVSGDVIHFLAVGY